MKEPNVSGKWKVNSEVAVVTTAEGVAFSTGINDIMKPLMWYNNKSKS